MRSKIGSVFMVLGTLMVLSALALFLYNQRQSDMAEEAAMEVMPEIVEAINVRVREAAAAPAAETLAVAVEEAPVKEMTESKINGYYYIGFEGRFRICL